jgi:isopenicillin N synthase-like dioxygenase
MKSDSTSSEFIIPTVDISAYLSDPTSSGAQEVISKLRDSCQSSGFFQITNHGISPELQKTVFKAAKTFFRFPQNEKIKYSGVKGRGYELIGSQILEPGTKPELKEVSILRYT